MLLRLRQAVRRWPGAPRWALWLTLVWALELFLVQELTLVPMHFQTLRSVITYRTVRFLLDLSVCATLVCALPRSALLALFLLNPLFYWTVLVYHDYFQQPLSIHVLLGNSAEGASVSSSFLPLLESWHAAFIVTLAIKVGLLIAGRRLPRSPWARRRKPALALAGSYAALVAVMNPLLQPLYKIGTWDSVSGLGSIYGYTPTWLAELVFLDVDALRERAVERGTAGTPADADRLVEGEAPFPVRSRLVMLQIESFDQALIDFRVDGREVTPTMNRLWQRGLHFVVQAPKGTGSSDADFRALMGREPSTDVPTYKIPGYPYTGSFVERLRGLGYGTAVIHGVTGEFFNRRRAFEQMPFDELLFKEEIVERRLATADGWAVADAELLEIAAQRLSALEGRQFQLIITATSHIPFPLPRERKAFFPDDTAAHIAYFDSAHYVDAAIGRFVELLPRGTTLVLYGDHVSKMENPALGYRQIERDGVGCVPFVVVDLEQDLSPLQQTPETLATSCELTLLQAFRYVHRAVTAGTAGLQAAQP